MSETIGGIEQGRAVFAYKCAEKGCSVKNYCSYVKKIPMYIKTNGLGATMAFIFSKSKKEPAYGLIYEDIKQWLQNDFKGLINLDNDDLTQKIVSLNSPEYRAATIEVLAFLNWLKRFATALDKDEDSTPSLASVPN